jgi:chromosome segregation ATPase
MFTGAISNLESRLDTILADETDPAARQRLADQAQKDTKARQRAGSGTSTPASAPRASQEGSRTRAGNDRLAERLARATAKKNIEGGSALSSEVPSRVGSPAVGSESGSPRPSSDGIRDAKEPISVSEKGLPKNENEEESDKTRETAQDIPPQSVGETPTAEQTAPSTLLSSGLPINPARISTESSTRPSLDTPALADSLSSRPSSDLPDGSNTTGKSTSELEAEMSQMRADYEKAEKQRQEEMHAHLERIDALQAKLQYLAKETVAAAKEANASAATGSLEAKNAEKDERIALLMEEGEKLSKTELRHLQTIKKLRAKAAEDEKSAAELRKKLDRAERSEAELKQKVRRAEAAERQANEKVRQIAVIEKQVDEMKVDRERAAELIRTLTTQLKETEQKVKTAQEEAQSKATEIDKNRVAELENALEDATIEKKLAEDRAKSETRKLKDEADRQRERFSVREVELKNEIASLDSRLEAMRARAEEASSEGGVSGEGSLKLLRQVEQLQSQYSLAKGNWETIEGSLNARLSALEQERDEATKREADVRKKARDAANKTRRAEDELEASSEQISTLNSDLRTCRDELASLRKAFEQADAALADAKSDQDHQRRIWESEFASRLEDEKARWQQQRQQQTSSRLDSPSTSSHRKYSSHVDPRRPLSRIGLNDLSALQVHLPEHRPTSSSRRSSGFPTTPNLTTPGTPNRETTSPSLSRQESMLNFTSASLPPTPSIEVPDADMAHSQTYTFEAHSPHRGGTINDLVSTSTAGAGPSVQLVERMSAAVRRLETEKAASKDELVRLGRQRDEARDEVVALMREVEGKRRGDGEVEELRKELNEVKARYEACLQMVGEKEEEVEELRGDVGELKRIYRELVESKVGGGVR